MFSLPFDAYPFLRPLLFRIDPEKAHALALAALRRGLVPMRPVVKDPVLNTSVFGLTFAHPIGLAAGFDKQAEAVAECFDFGFSFVELGGVTPEPQPGNPKPRLFRIPEANAVINRCGFNSVGASIFARRLIAFHDTQTRAAWKKIIGVNLCVNKSTQVAADDLVKGMTAFAGLADYLTVNVSPPDTPELRNAQARDILADLLERVLAARAATGKRVPVWLKIAPDIAEDQAQDIAEVALAAGIDGMIVSNTTVARPSSLPPAVAKEAGGLSGEPLFEMSTELLRRIYRLTGGKIPLIGSGGVFTGADAYAKIRAGASLVQLYTALVYEGPWVVSRITEELASLLKQDGFASVAEAVGADC